MKIEKEISMAELSKVLNMKLGEPESYDLGGTGLEVESFNTQTQQSEFKPISEFLVKPSVPEYFQLGELKGTSNHRVLYGGKFVKLKNHPHAIKVIDKMSVVDISVDDNETYFANGQICHNTTSGGKNLLPL